MAASSGGKETLGQSMREQDKPGGPDGVGGGGI